jgi:hypothetical protein
MKGSSIQGGAATPLASAIIVELWIRLRSSDRKIVCGGAGRCACLHGTGIIVRPALLNPKMLFPSVFTAARFLGAVFVIVRVKVFVLLLLSVQNVARSVPRFRCGHLSLRKSRNLAAAVIALFFWGRNVVIGLVWKRQVQVLLRLDLI